MRYIIHKNLFLIGKRPHKFSVTLRCKFCNTVKSSLSSLFLMQKIILPFVLIIAVIAGACRHDKSQNQHLNYILQGDEITIPDSSNIKPEIKLAQATKEPYKLQLYSAAKIKAIPNK